MLEFRVRVRASFMVRFELHYIISAIPDLINKPNSKPVSTFSYSTLTIPRCGAWPPEGTQVMIRVRTRAHRLYLKLIYGNSWNSWLYPLKVKKCCSQAPPHTVVSVFYSYSLSLAPNSQPDSYAPLLCMLVLTLTHVMPRDAMWYHVLHLHAGTPWARKGSPTRYGAALDA